MAVHRQSKYKRSPRKKLQRVSEERIEFKLPAKQIPLFNNGQYSDGNGRTVFRDPAFGDNKVVPVHRWVPWIAGYSAQFVDDVITVFLGGKRGAQVLDPFCGVGTTLLQAMVRGHNTIGFEINPYPALAARAKLCALELNLKELDEITGRFVNLSKKWKSLPAPPGMLPPPLKSRIPFFSPGVEKQVLHALNFMNSISSHSISELFRTAFGAVMVSFSNYTYEPSLGSRPGAGKPLVEDADVGGVLLKKLLQMCTDIAWIQEEFKHSELGLWKVINKSFFSSYIQMEPGAVNLVVTSPPYMNNYHYVRNTRPQLYWLSFVSCPEEQRYLETENFGKFWQTVRDTDSINLSFEHSGLQRILRGLRSIRQDQEAYGGPGWANYVASYFNDCYRFLEILKTLLARNGVAVIVIGNSIIQGMNIRTDHLIGEIGQMLGLKLEGVHCIREKRVGSSITQSSVRKGERVDATLSESAVVFRR